MLASTLKSYAEKENNAKVLPEVAIEVFDLRDEAEIWFCSASAGGWF